MGMDTILGRVGYGPVAANAAMMMGRPSNAAAASSGETRDATRWAAR